MYTEKEAKTKWCPFVRSLDVVDESPPSNSHYGRKGLERNPDYARCIASKCMMWRCAPGRGMVDVSSAGVSTTGYCGLAGKQ